MSHKLEGREFWIDLDNGQVIRVKPFSSDYVRFTHVLEAKPALARIAELEAENEKFKSGVNDLANKKAEILRTLDQIQPKVVVENRKLKEIIKSITAQLEKANGVLKQIGEPFDNTLSLDEIVKYGIDRGELARTYLSQRKAKDE